jgi:CDP-diacylglycerol---glycerol-3-phosphate 3-phosphatidyltransferase
LKKNRGLKPALDRLLTPLCRALVKLRVGPDLVTLTGVFVTVLVPLSILQGRWIAAGLWLLAGGFFDVLDGALARHLKVRSRVGAFWDSTLDRVAEALVFGGLLFHFARSQDLGNFSLCFVVQTLSFLVPYARARAEGLGLDCEVGVLPRPGRVVLLTLGFLAGRPEAALWAVGVLSLVTFGQRVFWVWFKTRKSVK